ncbi:MAG TPA: DUF4430 domain-containing protein [Solirubrobacteraceae bacterium]|jgi:hypothetical protein|nr:DUF4430 domain-containing protein [Solirubrobacteraceae bacterium]
MHRKTLIALLGAMIIAVAAAGSALAAGSGPSVRVQIKTLTKTVRQVVVHGQTGWITKGGTPRGKCPGNSAAGALNAATHGKWSGKYYASVGGIFVTSILGVTPTSPDYWSLYVNGKPSSQGACAVHLHAGERLLFKVVK